MFLIFLCVSFTVSGKVCVHGIVNNFKSWLMQGRGGDQSSKKTLIIRAVAMVFDSFLNNGFSLKLLKSTRFACTVNMCGILYVFF